MMSLPIENFIGAMFTVTFLAILSYGAFCAQLYYHWTNYHAHVTFRSFVVIIGLLETAHAALNIHILYNYLLSAWGKLLVASNILPFIAASISAEVAIISLIQGWYIYRIWRSRQQVLPVAFLTTLLFASIGLSFGSNGYLTDHGSVLDFNDLQHIATKLSATYGFNMWLNVFITSVLVFYFMRRDADMMKRSTKHTAASIVTFSLSSGLLVATACIGYLVYLKTANGIVGFGGITQLLAKLYANSMLAALNTRQLEGPTHETNSDTKFDIGKSDVQTHATPVSIISSRQ